MIKTKSIKSILLVGCLLLIVQQAFAQTDVSKKILGKWQFESEEKVILSTNIIRTDTLSKNTTPDNFFQKGIDLSFKDATNLALEMSHEGISVIVPYAIKDSVFTIVKRPYRILQVNEEVLLFKVATDSIQTKYRYKKMN